ncbi:Fe-S cluster assembly ATPase SufC [Candidatus Shikimatogenerans bostrichidophilus]|uniref:Fe-S cluster assembly ATPase SufC n=1 Tax=Candidatus Shikimatogenerans bostrichidophilus TaxID=2943807 RepID=UPI0029661338
MLEIKNLYVKIKNNLIIKGLNLKIKKNEIHVIMGPNGSGKSTLSYIISGKPKYIIDKGKILFNKKLINNLSPYEISKLGIFLSFQYPIEINGITMYIFLKNILKNKYKNKVLFKKIYKVCKKLNINKNNLYRYFNVGFSGGEKKKNEILQMLLLKPKLVILDEIDSGLDIDTLNLIFKNINKYKKKYKCSLIIITHNTNIVKYINPNYVHILYNGKIIKSSNKNIIYNIDKYGYKKIIKNENKKNN